MISSLRESTSQATLSDQISRLLRDESKTLEELSLLYSYRFGHSIKDALHIAGFDGRLVDFIDQHKNFSTNEGYVSVLPAAAITNESHPEDSAAAGAKPFDMSGVCMKAMDEEALSAAETESTADAESDYLDTDSDVDVTKWRCVGHRLAAALSSPSISEAEADAVRWRALSDRVAVALRSDDEDDAHSKWQALGDRVAAALRSDDEGEDAEAWHDVGSRIVAACKHCDNDECCEDDSFNAAQWQSVGARLLRHLDTSDCDADDEADDL